MILLLSFTPIVFLFLTLFYCKWPLTKAAPATFVYTLILTWLKWDLSLPLLASLTLKSALLAIDVLVILFGAILFLGYLRASGLIVPMQMRLSEISHDKRIQAFLLAWLFGSFLEGISGFGTPAAIIAPLMVGLGFPALQAVYFQSSHHQKQD
jgi:lactate permease